MRDVVLDACCLINLYASGELRVVVGDLGGCWYVPDTVASEALFLRETDGGQDGRIQAELAPLTEEGVLRVTTVRGVDEEASYVNLAAQLDDGEAMALAIAHRRGFALAKDDGAALRVAKSLGVAVVTTPQLLRQWSEQTTPDESRLSRALVRIERLACYRPGRRSPEFAWWEWARGQG